MIHSKRIEFLVHRTFTLTLYYFLVDHNNKRVFMLLLCLFRCLVKIDEQTIRNYHLSWMQIKKFVKQISLYCFDAHHPWQSM